jgi:hypothetical protein
MAILHNLEIPDELYEYLQDLAKADNSSINAQVKTILQQALSVQIQQAQERRRQNILNLLEESRRRREGRRTDVEWLDSTELIREDRNR